MSAAPLFRPERLRLSFVIRCYDEAGEQIPPRTKKNHSRIVQPRGWKRPKLLPSVAFEKWQKAAEAEMTTVLDRIREHIPIAFAVNCKAIFFREALTGDAVGYYQALGDFLQHIGVLKDDKFIVQWDGSRLMKDAADPRIELVIEELR